MQLRNVRLLIVAVFGLPLLPAQITPPEITSIGYYAPTVIRVTPGQFVTLFVRGLSVSKATANSVPLPTSLGGISVTAKSNTPGFPTSLPILRVDSYDAGCIYFFGERCDAAAVTVQIPMEGTCTPSISDLNCATEPALLTVQANGVASRAFRVSVDYRFQRVHVLTSDDSLVGKNNCFLGGCEHQPYITHADGSLVTSDNPAHAGETIVVYAVGLGTTTPAVKTGDATPSPAPTAQRPMALLSYVIGGNSGGLLYPVYAGLVTGYVGLYQVNLELPTSPPDRPCQPSQEGNVQLTFVGSDDSPVVFCFGT